MFDKIKSAAKKYWFYLLLGGVVVFLLVSGNGLSLVNDVLSRRKKNGKVKISNQDGEGTLSDDNNTTVITGKDEELDEDYYETKVNEYVGFLDKLAEKYGVAQWNDYFL